MFLCILVHSEASVPLSWATRMAIALGAAKGLAFLHNAERPVIYRDFKTSNILLDSVSGALNPINVQSVRILFILDNNMISSSLSHSCLLICRIIQPSSLILVLLKLDLKGMKLMCQPV